MNYALTNIGERISRSRDPRLKTFYPEDELNFLGILRHHKILESVPEEYLMHKTVAKTDETRGQVAARYADNPVRYIQAMIIEGTNMCGWECKACHKAYVPKATEEKKEDLKSAINDAKKIGISNFAFVGGEVTKFFPHLLGMIGYAANGEYPVMLFTNGWWGISDFESNGVRYSSPKDFAKALKDNGLFGIYFSIDGIGEVHDRFRNQPGSYKKIMTAVQAAKEVGLQLFLSTVLHPNLDQESFFAEMTKHFSLNESGGSMSGECLRDLKTNGLHVIGPADDVGRMRRFITFDEVSPDLDSIVSHGCKGFFRPMYITIKANGEVATCPLVTAGEGYENIHEESLIEILNSIQDSPLYKAHRESKLDKYVGLLDRKKFRRFKSPCAAYVPVSMAINETVRLGKSPSDLTPEEIKAINELVSQQAGFQE